jgi:hypothetical protein
MAVCLPLPQGAIPYVLMLRLKKAQLLAGRFLERKDAGFFVLSH